MGEHPAYTRSYSMNVHVSEKSGRHQNLSDIPAFPLMKSGGSPSDEEVKIAILRAHAMRAEVTRLAIVGSYKALVSLPEKIGNWLKPVHIGAHHTH